MIINLIEIFDKLKIFIYNFYNINNFSIKINLFYLY